MEVEEYEELEGVFTSLAVLLTLVLVLALACEEVEEVILSFPMPFPWTLPQTPASFFIEIFSKNLAWAIYSPPSLTCDSNPPETFYYS